MQKRRVGRAPILAAVVSTCLLAGCGPDIGGLPTDPAKAIGTFVSEAQDADRASRALGWQSKVAKTALSSTPADLDEFRGAVCDPPFYPASLAAKALQGFNGDLSDLATAPDDSLGAYLKAIRLHQKQLQDLAATAKPPASEDDLRSKLVAKCGAMLDRDLALQGTVGPQSFPATVGAALGLLKVVTVAAQTIEAQQRAEVVRQYVLAHEQELNKALEVLASKSDGLQPVIQATRTYYIRRAYAAYSDLDAARKSGKAPVPPITVGTADDYMQFTDKYLKLQGVDAQKLLDDPDQGLRPAYKKFVEEIKDPLSNPYKALDNFFGFWKAISDINSAREDYLKALKEMSGGS